MSLEKCVQCIRAVPGHERFLLGATAQEKQQQAKDGPIVVVSITKLRADAILISMLNIRIVTLPDFSFESIQAWTEKRLNNFTRNDYGKKNKHYVEYLEWVWCVTGARQINSRTRHRDV